MEGATAICPTADLTANLDLRLRLPVVGLVSSARFGFFSSVCSVLLCRFVCVPLAYSRLCSRDLLFPPHLSMPLRLDAFFLAAFVFEPISLCLRHRDPPIHLS